MPAPGDRIAALTGWRRMALGAVAGAGLGLAHTPFGLWPLAFVAGPALYAAWRGGGGFWLGWAAGVAFFAVTLHWIVEPFLVDAPRYGWMAPFALVLMAGGLALFWGGAFWLAGRFRRGGAATLALLWAGAEALRGGVFTGFPWALPAYVWVDTPVAQLSSVTGAYGLSLLTLFAMLVLGARPFRLTSPLVFATVIGVWIWGDMRAARPLDDAAGPMVRIVQPNIPQARKWDRRYARANFDATLALTAAPAQGAAPDAAPDLVIWPEVAVTFAIEQAVDAQAEIAAAAGGAPVILGSLAPSPLTNRWRNALIALGPDGAPTARYDKSHLVPFGEYLPFADIMERLGLLALAGRGPGMEAGPPPRPLTLSGLPAFTPLICYEGVFPREVRAAASGAEWIVLITNDAWFGGWAGPAQHLAQARMRAIETGLPIARSANTGISSIISPYGRAEKTASLNTRSIIDARLPAPAPQTIYSQLGETPAIFVSFLLLLASLWRARQFGLRRHGE